MPGNILSVLLLALIQGLTEFLPVSSSGHMVIAEAFLGHSLSGAERSMIFEIAVHIGTLGAVIVFYRKKVASLVTALWSWIRSGFRKGEGWDAEVRYAGWILLGSVPAGIVGVGLHDRIASSFNSPAAASALLVLTGAVLLLSRGRGSGSSGFTLKAVILIGLAQAVAVLPGCSRSGWTITAALLAGIGFNRAAEFSFMLSIPAVLGALLLELVVDPQSITPHGAMLLLLGAAAAFLSGLVALKLLIRSLKDGYFHRFSWYLLPAGIVLFIYFIRVA